MVAENGRGSHWAAHYEEILQDPDRAHAQQRKAFAEFAAGKHKPESMNAHQLERHYRSCAKVFAELHPAPSAVRSEISQELEHGVRLIAEFSRRQKQEKFIDIDAGIKMAQRARTRLQAFEDYVASMSNGEVLTESTEISREAVEKIRFIESTPLLLVHLDRAGNEIWEKPTRQPCIRYREGREVCRRGVYCKRLHFIPKKDCTNRSYLLTGICSNYSKCRCRHPWDTERWGDHDLAYKKHLEMNKTAPPMQEGNPSCNPGGKTDGE